MLFQSRSRLKDYMATAHYLLSCRLYFKQHLMNLMLAARFDCVCVWGLPKLLRYALSV